MGENAADTCDSLVVDDHGVALRHRAVVRAVLLRQLLLEVVYGEETLQ